VPDPDPAELPGRGRKGDGKRQGGSKGKAAAKAGADEGGARRYQMILKSRSGSIETFLVSPQDLGDGDKVGSTINARMMNGVGDGGALHWRKGDDHGARGERAEGGFGAGEPRDGDGAGVSGMDIGMGIGFGLDEKDHHGRASPTILKLAPPESDADYWFMNGSEECVARRPLPSPLTRGPPAAPRRARGPSSRCGD